MADARDVWRRSHGYTQDELHRYLDAALDEMRKRYKTIDGYFADGLGLDAATIDRLRAAYIEEV